MSRRPVMLSLRHKLGHDEKWRHLQPTPFELPSYSAPALPFRWMNREGIENLSKIFPIGYDSNIEPRDGWMETSSWVLHPENQKRALDAFWGAIKPKSSLCFFYAKGIPQVEDTRRVLVGVGRVLECLPLRQYIKGDANGFEAWVWERSVLHSIEPTFQDGFVLPYHALLKATEKDPKLDFADFIAFASEDQQTEFSYASEHVTADAALQALEACRIAIGKAQNVVEGHWGQVLNWINNRQSEVLQQRGPYPGLGAVLTATGLAQGITIAAEAARDLPPDIDPWTKVLEIVQSPKSLPAELRANVTPAVRDKLLRLQKPDKEKRWQFLRLLSRFALSVEQAGLLWQEDRRKAAGIECTDDDFLANPYLIYEQCRLPARIVTISESSNGEDDDEDDTNERRKVEVIAQVSFRTVDRGIFLPLCFSQHHPLWKLGAMEGSDDNRRLRAIMVYLLAKAERDGHSMLPEVLLLEMARGVTLEPPCMIDTGLIETYQDFVEEQIVFHKLGDGTRGFQLNERDDLSNSIRGLLIRALRTIALSTNVDWRSALDQKLAAVTGIQDEAARCEKALALKQLSVSRFSVLVGPAGTGKTTLLSALCSESAVRDGGVLLLAPTGKARVRLQKEVKMPAQTIAQYLLAFARFHPETGRYLSAPGDGDSRYKTVIVDEASMLTEDQLAALLETVGRAERIILVGDPGQLPPIGVGRPFVDLVKALEPTAQTAGARTGPGYAELSVRMRQSENGEDLELAELFSGRGKKAGDDEIMFELETEPNRSRIQCIQWGDAADLLRRLKSVVIEEFSPDHTLQCLPTSLGASQSEKGNWFFNVGAESRVENWQLLSPVRMSNGGTEQLNRVLQQWLRGSTVSYANSMQTIAFRIPRPCGPQQVVYGDKVINLSNRRNPYVWPRPGALQYLANGEIGVVVGETASGPRKDESPWFPKHLKIAFSSQPGFAYSFLASAFREEGEPDVELAYAITVHKAQGSDFSKTVVVIPDGARSLCRELLYTALTRHRNKLLIFHQGPVRNLLQFRSSKMSAISRRFTTINLRATEIDRRPAPVVISDPVTGCRTFYENYLIHRTRSGTLASSKSELIVGYELEIARNRRQLQYVHEAPFDPKSTGRPRYPDFIIEVHATGRTFIWEHCGMLGNSRYREKWERKLRWYSAQGITRWDPLTNPYGELVVSEDDSHGGIDAERIKSIVEQICAS